MKSLSTTLALVLLLATPAAAQTDYTWNGSSGSWFTATNWSPVGIPGGGDTALITSGSVDIARDTTVAVVTFSGGRLVGGGILTVTETITWSGGNMGASTHAGSVTISEGATLRIEGEATKRLSGRDILNNGTIVWEGVGSLQVTSYTLIENREGATFDMRSDATLTRSNGGFDFVNSGLLVKSGGTGSTNFVYPFGRFANHGIVRVESGTLMLSNGISSFTASGDGTFEVESGATLRFNQANYFFGAGSSVTGAGTLLVTGGNTRLGSADLTGPTVVSGGALRFTSNDVPAELADVALSGGNFGGTGVKNVNGLITWTGGSLGEQNGIINIFGGASAEGEANKFLSGGTYNNAGTFTWSGTGNLVVNRGGRFNNLESGTFDIQNDAVWTRTNGGFTFVNEGLVTKSGGTGTTSISTPFGPFNNDGVVRVETGLLSMNVNNTGSNSTDTGAWKVEAGAQLHFSNHRRTFTETASIEGAGTVHFASNATFINRGTIRPGAPLGTLTVSDNYPRPQPTGVIEIELAGSEPDVEHDVFSVTNIANLGGILRLDLADDFEPRGDEAFTVVTAQSVVGKFECVESPQGYGFELSYGAQDVTARIGDNNAVGVYAEQPLAREHGPVPGVFVIRAVRPFDEDTRIPFELGGSASLFTDYVLDVLGNSVVIPQGEQEVRVRVIPLPDDLRDPDEDVVLTLTHRSGDECVGTASVTIVDGPPSDEFDMLAVFPRIVGESSSVRLHARGQSIPDGAPMRLVRDGQSIRGRLSEVNDARTSLSAIFEIPAGTRGDWDVVIEPSSQPAVTLPSAISVVEGRQPEFHVELTGPRLFRTNLPAQRYYVNISNRGTSDAVGVPVWVVASKNGDWVRLEPDFDVIMPEPPEGLGITSWSDPALGDDRLTTVLDTGDELILSFLIPVLPAGASVTYPFYARTYRITAWANEPFFDGYPNEADIASLAKALVSSSTGGDLASCIFAVGGAAFNIFGAGQCIKNATDAVLLMGGLVGGTLALGFSSPTTQAGAIHAGAVVATIMGAVLSCAAELNPATKALATAGRIISGGAAIAGAAASCAPLFARKPPRKLDADELRASDPNDKLGPVGGDLAAEGEGRRFVTGQDPFGYLIRFENKPEATAPALEVLVEDRLDPDRFNLQSFSFGRITFGDQFIDPPPGLSRYQASVPVDGTSYTVLIAGNLDINTGDLVWRFSTVDTQSGGLPTDVFAGFLPPNQNAPEGEGSVFFTVHPRDDLADGTQIQNMARIYFDLNDPIDTPEWVNTIDANPPTSTIDGLDAEQPDSVFAVSWSGSDDGSGVAYYRIFVSENDEPYQLWLNAPAGEESALFTGEFGKSYAFYSVAVDAAGNVERVPTGAQASTHVGVGTATEEEAEDLPTVFALHQNYPNPFNPSTVIRFSLPEPVDVRLEVVDLLGRRIALLAEGPHPAGRHVVTWDASEVASNVYFYVLRAGSFRDVKRMVLVR